MTRFEKAMEHYDSYDDFIRDLFAEDLDQEFTLLILMHSGLEKLERYDETVQQVIMDYDLLKEWRDEAGEVT